MTIGTVTAFSGTAPARTQDPSTFSTNVDAFLSWVNTFPADLNSRISEMNTDIAQANTDATNAANSASDADTSATAAAAAGNLLGTWSSQSGSQNKPASVTHNGSLWALLNNLADITASEPGVSADWFEIKVLSATTRSVTAEGAVSLADFIASNSDGTGSKIAQTDSAVVGNAIVEFESGDMSTYPLNQGSLCYVADQDALVLVYNDPGVGLKAVAFSINTSTGVLTPGTAVTIVGSECAGYSVAYGTVNDQLVFCYSYGGNIYGRNYTISGTALTAVTSEVSFESDTGDNMVLVHDADYSTNDRFWLFYRATNHSNAGYYLDVTNTSGTLTDSSAASFEGGATLDINATYVGGNKAAVTYIDDADTDTPKAVFAGWSSATSSAIGSVFELTADAGGGTCVAYDSLDDLVTFLFYNETKNIYQSVVMPPPGAYNSSVSNTYDEQNVTTSWSHQPDNFHLVFDPVSRLYFYFFEGNSNTGEVAAFARDGGTLVEESQGQFEDGTNTGDFAVAVDSENGFPVIAYVDAADTSKGKICSIDAPSTVINMWNYSGIAQGAAADGVSFTMQTSGVNSDQSGLTAGQDYWLSPDMSLVTYPSGPYVGRAISATELDMDAVNPAAQVVKKITSGITADIGTPVRIANDRLQLMGTRGALTVAKLDIDSVAQDTGAWSGATDWLMQSANGGGEGVGYDSSRGIMCVAYHYDSNNGSGTDSLYISVFDVSDFRNPVHLLDQSIQSSVTPYEIQCQYIASLDRWMLSWAHSGNSYPYYHQFLLDGDGKYTSLNSVTNVSTAKYGAQTRQTLRYDQDENAWIFAYGVSGTNNCSCFIAPDNGGGTLSWGSVQLIEGTGGLTATSRYYGVDIEYDPVEQVWVALYSYSNSYYLRVNAFTVDGSAKTISAGSAQYAFSTSTNLNWPFIRYIPSLGACVAVCFDTSNNIYAEVHTATGTSIAITNDDTDVESNCSGYSSYDFNLVHDTDKDALVLITLGGFSVNAVIDVNSLKSRTTGIATSSYVTGEGGNYGVAFFDDESKVVHSFSGQDGGNENSGDALKHYSWVLDFPTGDTDEFAGVIGHATKPGAETSIVLDGLIGGLSGLSANAEYYVGNNGELSLANLGNGRVGKAISATELVI